MAFITENTATGDGSTTDFSFTFPYINESDVKVTITDANGDPQSNTDFTFANATTLSFNTAPTSGRTIRIFRDTNLDNAVVTFFAGSAIRAEDLNDNQNQVLFSAQEVENNAVLTTGSTITGDQVFTTGTVVFEGATADDNETTLAVTDPTADRTITLPNADGHVALFTADPGSTTISATPAELNTLDGITASTAELNLMDGVTATTAELNLLDGVTSTTAELNILDGVTATAAELNLMDGVTATTAELNFVDGVTSNVQTQLDNKQPLDAELTELATMGSTTAAALADLTEAEVQILDGATVSTAELNLLDGVTATTGELNHVDGVTSNVQTQLNNKQPLDAELTELATMASGTASALADLSQAEVQILDGATVSTAELNTLDGVTASTAELNLLDGVTATTAELNKLDGVTASTTELNALDGITSTVTELNLLDGVTATTAELNILDGVTATASELNQLDGNTLSSSSTDFTSSSQYPSAAEIDSRITARIDPIGGFEAIADEDSFPATAPPAGTVVSIANANGLAVNASGVGAGTRAGGSDAVVINGFPSEFNSTSLDSGIGLLVIATSTAHTYDFHRVVAKNEDVRQLSSDINDFKARYRVGSSNPTTSLDEGDLFYNTGSDKMLVYDGSAWTEVQSIGEYFIIPATELADFASGTASTEVISNAPANASQIILSINGVIQEPNSGTSAPTDGFALDGSTIRLAATPPASSEVWGVIIGSTVNIGTPSANTVGPTQLIDTAVTAGSYTLSSITVDAQGRITAASSGSAGAADKIEEGNTNVECVDTGSNGHILFDTEGSERMRIDNSGRLLINSTTNDYTNTKLLIAGTAGTNYVTLLNTTATDSDEARFSYLHFRGTQSGGEESSLASISAQHDGSSDDERGELTFRTNDGNDGNSPTERMRIDSSGNVGIGTTSPSTKLHVNGTIRMSAVPGTNTNASMNVLFQTSDGDIDGGSSLTWNPAGDSLSVNGAFISSSQFRGTGSSTTFTSASGNGNYDFRATSDSLRFIANSTANYEAMRLNSSGRMLLGTSTNPTNSSALVIVQGLAGNKNEQGIIRLQRGNNNGNNNRIGVIEFGGSDRSAAEIRGVGDGTWASNDYPGRLEFHTTKDGSSSPTERFRINQDGRFSGGQTIDVTGNLAAKLFALNGGNSNYDGHNLVNISGYGGNTSADGTYALRVRQNVDNNFHNGNSAALRIENSNPAGGSGGALVQAWSNRSNSTQQLIWHIDRDGGHRINRPATDGTCISFQHDQTTEGSIQISGTTVSYNGGHLSRWSQLADGVERVEILRGSVLSNLDEMCEWIKPDTEELLWTQEDLDIHLLNGDEGLPGGAQIGDVKEPATSGVREDNEQLNRMKVSDVEGDKNVAGVFVSWDDDDDTYTNDFYCAMTGDFVIRIAKGTTVARGDLLMSAGDGTAKPQDDDIVRSKTIAKVTSTTVSETYADGSYCVPCVLMAC